MTDERTFTAMYDARGAAETARDELISLGISDAAITIRGTGASAAEVAPMEHKGFWASLSDLFVPDDDRDVYAEGLRRGGYLLTVQVPAGLENQASDVLERSEPVDLDARATTWRQSGWTGYQEETLPTEIVDTGLSSRHEADLGGRDVQPSARAPSAGGAAGEEMIQAAEEQLRVGKREAGRGSVRVRSYVTERPVEEQVTLTNETVRVERRPVDRPVAAGDLAFQDKQLEATERREEAVVSKEARVTEEISLRKDVDTRTETVRDTVRKQEIEVEDERTGPGINPAERRLRAAVRPSPVAARATHGDGECSCRLHGQSQPIAGVSQIAVAFEAAAPASQR